MIQKYRQQVLEKAKAFYVYLSLVKGYNIFDKTFDYAVENQHSISDVW